MRPAVARGGFWLACSAYIVLLHAVLLVLVVKTNFLLLAGKTLGFLPPEEWNTELATRLLEQAGEDKTVPPGQVVLLGDSIIAQLDARQITQDTVNFGIGGDTTRTLHVRLPVLRSVPRGRAAVIGVGVNDLKYRPVEQIARDYQTMLDQLPPMLPVLAVSVLPVDENGPAARQRPYLRNAHARALNAEIKRLCAARAGCGFLDAWPVLAQDAVHAGDGWHLSAKGNLLLARAIRDALPAR